MNFQTNEYNPILMISQVCIKVCIVFSFTYGHLHASLQDFLRDGLLLQKIHVHLINLSIAY